MEDRNSGYETGEGEAGRIPDGGAEAWRPCPIEVVDRTHQADTENQWSVGWQAAQDAMRALRRYGLTAAPRGHDRNNHPASDPSSREVVLRSEFAAVVAELRRELSDSRREVNELRLDLGVLHTHKNRATASADKVREGARRAPETFEAIAAIAAASHASPSLLSIGSTDETHAAGPPDADSPPSIESRIRALAQLPIGWDDEGAPPPSELAVNAALLIAGRLPSDLQISEVEADVIGGIVIWIEFAARRPSGTAPRWVWFAVRNNGKVLLAFDEHVSGGSLSVAPVETLNRAFDRMRRFLGDETR